MNKAHQWSSTRLQCVCVCELRARVRPCIFCLLLERSSCLIEVVWLQQCHLLWHLPTGRAVQPSAATSGGTDSQRDNSRSVLLSARTTTVSSLLVALLQLFCCRDVIKWALNVMLMLNVIDFQHQWQQRLQGLHYSVWWQFLNTFQLER